MLKLSDNYVVFEAGSKSDVFFDNVNKKICTVRSNGAMGITTKGLKDEEVISFRTRDAGKINSLNFSTNSNDCLIAGIHRKDSTSVDFVFLDDKTANVDRVQDYRQPCKNAGSNIFGLEWINDKQVIFVNSNGVELYQFNPRKKTVKLIRNECFEPAWYVYYSASQLLICSSGVTCGILNLFIIQNGVIHKLPKFEADFGCSSWKPRLMNNDVTIASIYGKLYILVLKYGKNELNVERLNLYLLNNDAAEPPKLAHSLFLNLKGSVGVHVIDNVVVAHQMTTTKSFLFDIRLAKPAVEIKPFAVSTINISSSLKSVYDTDDIALYKQSWALFSPNLIADARFGIFTQLNLSIENSPDFITDKMILLEFIANRSNAKEIFLKTLKDLLVIKSLSIRQTAEVFNRIIEIPGTAHITTRDPGFKFRLITEPFNTLRVDYNSILQSVLFTLKEENPEMDMHFLSAITLEFLLVVRQSESNMDLDLLIELLLHALIKAGEFSKLKQLLQYRVLDDSKLLPHDLMSLGEHEFDQIAVDILRRQGKYKKIAEYRLGQGRPVEALRCLKDQKMDFHLCIRFLEAAWETGCRQTKYTIYTNLRDVRKLSCFDNPNDQLDKYTREFKLLFNDEELEEAERRFRLAAIGGSSASIAGATSSRRDSLDENMENTSVHSEEQIDLNNCAPGAGPSQKL